MIDSALYHRLAPVTRRFQLRRMFLYLVSIWCVAALIGLALWWSKSTGNGWSPWSLTALFGGTFVASMVAIWLATRNEDDFTKAAQDIEQAFPGLDSSLVTAIEQQPPTPHGTLGFLQQEVVRRAVYHGYQHSWNGVVPKWQMLALPLMAIASLLAFLTIGFGQMLTPNPVSYTHLTLPTIYSV